MISSSYKLPGEDKVMRYENKIIYRGVALKKNNVPILPMFCMWITAKAQYSKAYFRNAPYLTAVSLFRLYIAMFNCGHYCFLIKHEATGCLHCREPPEAHTNKQGRTSTEHYLNFYPGALGFSAEYFPSEPHFWKRYQTKRPLLQ